MGDFDEPFLGSTAVAAGAVTDRQLRKDYHRIHRDVYIAKGIALDAMLRARAAALWAGEDGILAGLSAAAAHGTKWIDPGARAELFRTGSRRSTRGVLIHGDALGPDEICIAGGWIASTPARTGYDLGRRLPFVRAVEMLDALCNATDLKPEEIGTLAENHRGARGIVALRQVLDLVDGGAESPPETRTRLLLIDGGLPRPRTQVEVRDKGGRIVAHCDMGWKRWKVVVEYDGDHHWTDEEQRTWDIDRLELLGSLGWQVIRVSSAQLRLRPHTVVARARAKLQDAGAPV
ncbi:endonuclease domain-containing protein [Rhodococcus sp. NPDC058514]|uniref:endonuclease domain-containing protein n=1 Tax=unclassified Rhodococcus (in: high G+C Gram-positive bacteria) TaxID=192944 RepID=UPI0036633BCA